MAASEQIVRLLVLLKALQASQRGIVVSRFADDRGWNKRDLYRDLKKVEKAGFPLGHEHGRYWLMKGWAAPTLGNADTEELVALFTARQMAAPLRNTGYGRALDRLWVKLSGKGPQGALLPPANGTLSIRSVNGIDYAPHASTLEMLDRAVATRRVVRLRYQRPGAELTDRSVEPGVLHWDPGEESLYLIGWCRLREAVRVFAVHRIRGAELLDESFAPRPEIDRERVLRNAFRLWRAENVQTVRLRFYAAAAARVRERRWHPSQRWNDTVTGGDLVMEIAAPEELVTWLLGFADGVQILEPTWLGDEVRARHLAAIEPSRSLTRKGAEGGVTAIRARPRARKLSRADAATAQGNGVSSRDARPKGSR